MADLRLPVMMLFVAGSLFPDAIAQTMGTRTLIDAQSVSRNGETGQITASGEVRVETGDYTLQSDLLRFNLNTQDLDARGQVYIRDQEGNFVRAKRLQWNMDTRTGEAEAALVHAPDIGTATARYVRDMEAGGHILEQASLTACPICEDFTLKRRLFPWRLLAEEIVHDRQQKRLYYRHAVLQLHDLPVLYLPWFMHPAPGVPRASGLLPPAIDLNAASALGVQYRQPIHWVVSPSQDLTITPSFFTKVHPLMQLEWRKRFHSGQISIQTGVTYDRLFDSSGTRFGDADWRGHINASGRFALTPDWQWGFNVQRQSADQYDLLYGISYSDYDTAGLSQRPRQALSQWYLTGHNSDYLVNIGLINTQDLTNDYVPEDTLMSQFHLAYAQDWGRWGNLELSAAGLATLHTDIPICPDNYACVQIVEPTQTGQAYTGLYWQTQSLLPGGWLFKPFAAARVSGQWSETGHSDAVNGWGLAGADLSWPLHTSASGLTLLIEPVFDLVVGTGSDFADSPWPSFFETSPDEFIGFRPNGSTQHRPWNQGIDVGAWLETTLLGARNIELFSRIGYRWSGLGTASAAESYAVLDLDLSWGDMARYAGRIVITDTGQVARAESRLGVTHGRWTFDLLHFASTWSDANGGETNGLGVQTRFELNRFWSTHAEVRHNFEANATLEWSVGIDYGDECSFFGIEYRRSESDDGVFGPQDSISLRFGLGGGF